MTRLNALLMALCAVAVFAYGAEQRKRGRAEQANVAWEASYRRLATTKRMVDTQYIRDTVRLWRTVARVDTLTATVERWKHDTVAVTRYVTLADSTIRACSAVVLSCEQRVAVRDSMLTVWQRRWETRPKPPSEFRKWTERGLGFALGYLAGR